MSENKPYTTTNPDDIDLIILLERAVSYFRRFKWAFIPAIIAGILLGFLAYFNSPKMYKSRMVLHPVFVTNNEEIQIIDNWDELLKKREYKTLSAAFNCDEDLLRKVVSLDAADILKVFTPNNPNGIYVDVRIKDNSILPDLQKAILFGLNNTEYVKQRLEVKKDNLRQMIDEVTYEVAKLDSIKSTVENILTSKEKNSSSLMIDVSGMNKQLIEMNEKLLGYKEELKFVNGVQVLQGFSRFDTPVSISLKVLIIIGLIVTLSITWLYTLFVIVRQKLKRQK